MVKRYALVDAKGYVDNVIAWDGKSEWEPPEGFTLQALPADASISAGDRLDAKGKLTERAEPEPVEEDQAAKLNAVLQLLVERDVLTADDLDGASITVDGVTVTDA